MPFDILACGFNAHGQLLPSDDDAIPADIFTPTVIARAETSARILFAGWSETLLELDNKLHHRGAGSLQPLPQSCKPPYRAFGDGLGLKVILGGGGGGGGGSGHTTAYVRAPSGAWECHPLASEIHLLAIAGNGKVLSSTSNGTGTPPHPTRPIHIHFTHSIPSPPYARGHIYTAGDPRHGRLLARDTGTSTAPPDAPGLVDALDGIAMAGVAAGGWVGAARSAERDVYLWGGRAGEDGGVICDLGGVGADGGEEVGVVDVERGADVVGVGVGMGHVVVLTEGGRVWGVGRAGSGQLGVGGEEFCEEWREIDIGEGRVVEVVAGGWATFVVVERP
ncbi:RCC1/BLIP-II [Morchella conica CCBAS932]|uniref:RCC1/BLIP-II n=1 Tax=Morchella conica CCBAS932 TaxID=1392247 RepID=A0A3N4KSK9_9PEZI|nr:RCC1/BLIP-II [Morchella conica CCBAS932]